MDFELKRREKKRTEKSVCYFLSHLMAQESLWFSIAAPFVRKLETLE